MVDRDATARRDYPARRWSDKMTLHLERAARDRVGATTARSLIYAYRGCFEPRCRRTKCPSLQRQRRFTARVRLSGNGVRPFGLRPLDLLPLSQDAESFYRTNGERGNRAALLHLCRP